MYILLELWDVGKILIKINSLIICFDVYFRKELVLELKWGFIEGFYL